MPSKAKKAAVASSSSSTSSSSSSTPSSSPVFDGLTFCISGSFSVGQEDLRALIVQHGGSSVATVSAACDILVSDGSDNAKHKQAVKKGKQVVTEDWLNDSVSSGQLSTNASFILHAAAAPVPPATKAKAKPAAKKASKAAAVKGKKGKRKGKRAADDDEEEEEKDDEDEEEEEKTKADKQQEDDEEEDEKEEEAAPKKKRAKKESAAAADAAADSPSTPPPQMKTVIVKGKAPVDEHCPVASSCHVLQDASGVWDAMLNQTNIGNNNNKSAAHNQQLTVWHRGADSQPALTSAAVPPLSAVQILHHPGAGV